MVTRRAAEMTMLTVMSHSPLIVLRLGGGHRLEGHSGACLFPPADRLVESLRPGLLAGFDAQAAPARQGSRRSGVGACLVEASTERHRRHRSGLDCVAEVETSRDGEGRGAGVHEAPLAEDIHEVLGPSVGWCHRGHRDVFTGRQDLTGGCESTWTEVATC